MSGGDDQSVSSSTDPMPSVLTVSQLNNVDVVLKNDLEEEGISVGQGSLLASQGYLVSPSLSNPTLQSLLASPSALQGAQLSLPDGIQIITVSSPSDLLPTQSDTGGRIWQVINPDQAIIAVGDVDMKPMSIVSGDVMEDTEQVGSSDLGETVPDVTSILMPPPPQPLPPGCPSWAARLKNCEKIGDYYRGYCDTEVELDILLTYHKQATQSFWGTRQSPSPAKQSTRFMWKSQYVPWDGIPFVNTGSRAVVMECQYGPRRKGSLAKKQVDDSLRGEYKQTCPARIYIKKVRKFPEYRIDPNLDKKGMKSAMDKAFHELKQQNIEKIGQDRYYVQLPLQAAHEFHDEVQGRTSVLAAPQVSTITVTAPSPSTTTNTDSLIENGSDKATRLHPYVVQKIREIVAGGETRVYHVRRLLRGFVVREMYSGFNDTHVQRHDLTLFPTVTDLKNQIHQAVKDIENGSLALTAPTVNVEPVREDFTTGEDYVQIAELNLLPQPVMALNDPVPETVTVTLTQGPGEDGGHVISRIETHLSDGTTQISTSLTPETAQLLARINPAMFPPGSLVQLQAATDVKGDIQENTMTLNGAHTTLETEPSYNEMDMEVQQSKFVGVGDGLSIQPEGGGTLCISGLDSTQGDASHIITTETHSLVEQNSDLINVTMVPTVQADLEDLQSHGCDVTNM